MAYRLIVFDFDGTLADSLAAMVAAYNRVAPEMGLRPIQDVDAARATPIRRLLRQLGVRFWRLPKLVRACQQAVAAESHAVKLHPGIAETLAELASRGYRLGVLSSNREDNIRACLRANGAESHFSFVVGYPKLFGKAKALRKILKTERLDRSALLFVGDELRDVEAGRKARVATAAVTWGFQAEKLLADGGATVILRRPTDLLAVMATPDPRYAALAVLLGEAVRMADRLSADLAAQVREIRERVGRMDRTALRDAVTVFAPMGTWDDVVSQPGVVLAEEIMRRLGELRIK